MIEKLMIPRLWKFKALDSLFFRDGTPHNAGEGGQGQVAANFPPYMTTLQGAIRTALAIGQGWSPQKPANWPEELGTPEDLGNLTLRGPYLFSGDEILFPAPGLFLQIKKDGNIHCTRLVPGEKIECDLGFKRLPQMVSPLKGAKSPEGYWLTRKGLEKVLKGKTPEKEDMLEQKELWCQEYRTGIEIQENRTAKDRRIYYCVHIRPKKDLRLGVLVSGVPEDWHRKVPKVINLGGEGRLAEIEVKNAEEDLLPPPVLHAENGKVRFTVVLTTPGVYEKDTRQVIEEGPPGVPGSCISACIGRIEQMGGWDIKNNCPRPLEPVIPAGSAWFFEAEEKELDNILALHGKCSGSKTKYGFGQTVIGYWRDEK